MLDEVKILYGNIDAVAAAAAAAADRQTKNH